MQQLSNIINNAQIKLIPPLSAQVIYSYDPHDKYSRVTASNTHSGKVNVKTEIIENNLTLLVKTALSSILAENLYNPKNLEYRNLNNLKLINIEIVMINRVVQKYSFLQYVNPTSELMIFIQ